MKPSSNKPRFRNLAEKSLILSALIRLSQWFYDKLPDSLIGHLFGGKDRHSENGVVSYMTAKIPLRRRIVIPVKRFFARHFEHSIILQFLRSWIGKLPALPIKCVGIFYFAFGAYASVAYLIQRFAMNLSVSDRDFHLSLLCLLVGGILTGSAKTCAEAITDSRILDLLLFRLLGIPKEAFRAKGTPPGRGNVAFAVGLAFGALGSLLTPTWVLIALAFIVFGYAFLMLPEVGVIALFVLFPFLSAEQTALLCAFVTLSWLRKLLCGKRLLATVSLDISVLSFALILYLGGVVSVAGRESMTEGLLTVCFMMGYFLTVNLIRTSEWIKRAVSALLLSLGAISAAALIKYGFARFLSGDGGTSLSALLPENTLTLIAEPNVLAALILLLLPFALVAYTRSRSGDGRFGYALIILSALLSLFLFPTAGGWIGAVVMLVVYLMLLSRLSLAKILCALALLPTVFLLLPPRVIELIGRVFRVTSQNTAVRQGVEALLGDTFVGGIGLGEAAFRRAFPLYSSASAEGVFGSYGLFAHLTLSVGITGSILFLALIIIFLRHCMSHLANSREDDMSLRLLTAAGCSAIFGALAMGAVNNLFYDDRVFLVFWLVIGLTSSTIRTTVRERIPQYLEGPYLEIDSSNPTSSYGRKVR